jgi:SAM-dependent methyltransferase
MSKNVKSFFESHFHRYINKPDFYASIATEIKGAIPKDRRLRFLDVGCGDSSFIKALSVAGVEADFLATDLSFNMIVKSISNLKGYHHQHDVDLVVADAFELPLKESLRFDIIHIDSVLHHLIGRTRGESERLAERIIDKLARRLSDRGLLIVEEVFYDSYAISNLTSFLIFYGLKIINFLHLDLSFTRDIRPGLEVNFFDEKRLVNMLGKHGFLTLINRELFQMPRSYRLFMLKEFGHITYSIKKEKSQVPG